MKVGEKNDGEFSEFDSIVVPARLTGFNEVYLGENRWPNLKVDRRRLAYLKYIAFYQTTPVSAITHYSAIGELSSLDSVGRYDVTFLGSPNEIVPVRFTASDICAVQSPRYTTLERILNAQSLSHAFPT